MYLKLKKYTKNTPLSSDQFKLKEFSLDSEMFVPDTELSCNKVDDVETDAMDSTLSFLVKFKAEYRGDPNEVKSKVSGLVLPENEDYTHKPIEGTHFESIGKNHYELHTTAENIEKIAEDLFTSMPVVHEADEVKGYLYNTHEEKEWSSLYSRHNRRGWRNFLKLILGEAYFKDHGKPELHTIKKALKADPEKAKPFLEKLISFDFFKDSVAKQVQEEIEKY